MVVVGWNECISGKDGVGKWKLCNKVMARETRTTRDWLWLPMPCRAPGPVYRALSPKVYFVSGRPTMTHRILHVAVVERQ